ncbi:MAG: Ribosomal RNA-processing protein 7 [Thelocarpon superellum]|nr:MAG: Ribosomal RNA-processing protein 7 [Thelocarpon superellum]
MSVSSHPALVQDYTTLALALPALSTFRDRASHYLYLRRHEPKLPTPLDARTLFVVNVPVDATEHHFRHLFASVGGGRVERVEFDTDRSRDRTTAPPLMVQPTSTRGLSRKRSRQERLEDSGPEEPALELWDRELHRPGSTALVVFLDRMSLEATMKGIRRRARKPVPWRLQTEGKVPELGSERYLAHHQLRYPPRLPLQASIDGFMTRYASVEAQRAQHAARLRQDPDEDGFVTVTRGGRTGPARQEEAQAAAEKQKKRDGLKNFYRFQTREERKKAHGELLRKFDEDRRRVGEMKRKRGAFKPE